MDDQVISIERPRYGRQPKGEVKSAEALTIFHEVPKGQQPAPLRDALTISRKLEEQAKKRTAQLRTVQAPAPISQQMVQLPLWDESVRGVPNAFLRAALFGVITRGLKGDEKAADEENAKRKQRAYLERREIHAQEGIHIVYTGVRLDQDDLDVWEAVLHIARIQALGNECRITAYQLLKALGKTDCGKNRDTLAHRLSRMNATALDVKVDRFSYEGSLINEVYRAEQSREYIIRLNPKLINLFAPSQFTRIDWSVRHELDGKPLAKWLHGFYSSHAKPHDLKLSTLLELAGCENAKPRSSRQNLRKALESLTVASNKHGQAFSYEICGDLVKIRRAPSKSQQKHLAKRKREAKKRGES
jgi:hypothetical protein